MKKLLGFSFLVGSVAMASMAPQLVRVSRNGQPVRVKSVMAETVGNGFVSSRVSVVATFGNKCLVPKPNELVQVAQHADQFRTLILTLATEGHLRACPMVYAPVDATIDLGTFTKPNDGLFSKIIVNGVEAQ